MSDKKPRRPGRKPGIALLGVLDGRAEASIWESLLKAEGIPCLVRNINEPAYYGGAGVPGPLDAYEVYVPGSALQKARGIVGHSPQTAGTALVAGESSLLPWILLAALAVAALLGGITLALLFQ